MSHDVWENRLSENLVDGINRRANGAGISGSLYKIIVSLFETEQKPNILV